jgi:N-formylglutamate deformylase
MNHETHRTLSDAEFLEQFAHCLLDPAMFSHGAHLRLAYLLLEQYGLEEGIQQVQDQIQAFVRHVGAEDKYHVTLTVAAVYIVEHFRQKSKAKNFEEFVVEFPRLKTHFKDLIDSHYGINIFQSERARTEYLKPDLLPF